LDEVFAELFATVAGRITWGDADMKKPWLWLMSHPLVALILGFLVGGAVASNAQPVEQPKAAPAVVTPGPTVTATVTASPVAPMTTRTVTVRTTAAPPPEYRSFAKFSGRGTKTTDAIEIPVSAMRWRICYSFRGGTNAQLQLIDPSDGSVIDLVLNEIGNYQDCTVRYEPTGGSYAFTAGRGTWSLDIQIAGFG
jgi:hypothetical protein